MNALSIAIVHSFYVSRNPSGENRAVEAQVAALRRAGHRVELFAARTDELETGRLYPLRAAWRVTTGRGRDPLRAIESFRPDVVHIHNLFPNFGRSWLSELTAPIVHTLHNYRPVCVNALLLRDGQICTLCPDGDRWAGVRYGCYRGSRVASIPLAWANRKGPGDDPLLRRANRIVVLASRQRSLLVDGGVNPAKLVDGANFLSDRDDIGVASPATGRDGRWLFVGRLSDEKGIVRLLQHWPANEPLTVVGDGPLRSQVEALAGDLDVTLLGPLNRPEVLAAMASAAGLVFPSIWFEAAPLVYLEALAVGLPVVAFAPSSVAESVGRDGTGQVSAWQADDLAQRLRRLRHDRPEVSARCRRVFDEQHSESAFVRTTVAMYRELAV